MAGHSFPWHPNHQPLLPMRVSWRVVVFNHCSINVQCSMMVQSARRLAMSAPTCVLPGASCCAAWVSRGIESPLAVVVGVLLQCWMPPLPASPIVESLLVDSVRDSCPCSCHCDCHHGLALSLHRDTKRRAAKRIPTANLQTRLPIFAPDAIGWITTLRLSRFITILHNCDMQGRAAIVVTGSYICSFT